MAWQNLSEDIADEMAALSAYGPTDAAWDLAECVGVTIDRANHDPHRVRNQCKHSGCSDPRRPGHGSRYCERHARYLGGREVGSEWVKLRRLAGRKRQRLARAAAGVCTSCGKREPAPRRRWCAQCAASWTIRTRDSRAAARRSEAAQEVAL